MSSNNWLLWLLLLVIYHPACQEAQWLEKHDAPLSFSSVKNSCLKKKANKTKQITRITALALSLSQYSPFWSATQMMAMQHPAPDFHTALQTITSLRCRKTCSWTLGHVHLGKCTLTLAPQPSAGDPCWRFRKGLGHQCNNLKNPSEVNEAAPEIKDVPGCLCQIKA